MAFWKDWTRVATENPNEVKSDETIEGATVLNANGIQDGNFN